MEPPSSNPLRPWPGNATLRTWLALVRPGDWLVAALALGLCLGAYPYFWQGGRAERAVVKRDGLVVADLPLDHPRQVTVTGALGPTVIAVEPGRARVQSDPGPRQLCVRQGWLARPGEVALCAPSHISLQIMGAQSPYDSLSY